MFGIGMPEMILILAVALIVIGPKKLPDLAKSMGKALGEFKKATSDLKESMQIDTELKDVKTAFKDINSESNIENRRRTGDAEEKPDGAALPDESPDAGNPMETLHAAFERRNTEASNSDTDPLNDGDAPVSGPDPEAATRKG